MASAIGFGTIHIPGEALPSVAEAGDRLSPSVLRSLENGSNRRPVEIGEAAHKRVAVRREGSPLTKMFEAAVEKK